VAGVIGALLLLAALPAVLACGYLLLLTLASARNPLPPPAPRRLRFEVVVPAHDEERGVGETVRSLLALDWPRHLFRVLVVADNCADATAERAREAGAEVLERRDPERRGKGYALELAFGQALAGPADAVVVIDADTLASPNLLAAFAARLEAGAVAVQADYAVRNPGDSWRTRLMAIALGAFHVVRSRGRERLGLSCGLRGNGMCFCRAALSQVPHRAFSLVEDLEYGLRLGEAGLRVQYAGEAHVWGEMVATADASRTQRQRWEGGRLRMALEHGPRLLRQALARRDRLLLDLAFDVWVPPLAQLALAVLAGAAASAGVRAWTGQGSAALAAFLASAAALVCYVLRGWQLSGTGWRGLADLALAPAYVAWKLSLRLRGSRRARSDWVRTRRQGEG
jgi:cellulose synthase/poly-beta-1,6-N-acetylglucosamine synthase-like glycosyltransferase